MCGVTEYPVTTLGRFRRQGAPDFSKPCQRSYGNRVEEMLDAASCTCISDSECLFGPLVAALFVLLVLSGDVFAARRKPSDCKPNPLETHQLHLRLISCTRDSSVVLERLALSIWSSSVCVCGPPVSKGFALSFCAWSRTPPCWMSQHEVVSPTDGVPEEDGWWHERCLSMQ